MYRLREIQRKDLEVINLWRNNPELIALLGAPYRFINLEVDIKWFESYMGNRGNAVRCAITENGKDEILGLVSLVSIDYLNQSAEFHIMIGDDQNQGKGIGTFAVRAMLNHAFYDMNLQRIELAVLEENERAKHLYEKCGFVYEGRKRKAKYKNGRFVDVLSYAILKSEFDPKIQGGGYTNKYNLPSYNIDDITSKTDIDIIIRQCKEAFEEPVSKQEIYGSLLDKFNASANFLYAFNEEIIGYVAFYTNDLKSRDAYISLIAVKPRYQHMHVGTRLLNECIELAKAKGMKSLSLEVKKNNKKAIAFYKANGFCWKNDKNEESYIFSKTLID